MTIKTTGGIQHRQFSDYDTKLWKNGLGITHDVLVIPDDANHLTFDVRVAVSPIVSEAKFSIFDGVERVFTVVEGDGVKLVFDDREDLVLPFEPLQFDSGLAPLGSPIGENVKVINIMARRGIWKIKSCSIASELNLEQGENDLSVAVALDREWVCHANGKTYSPVHLETMLLKGAGHLFAEQQQGRCLHARLRKVD